MLTAKKNKIQWKENVKYIVSHKENPEADSHVQNHIWKPWYT